MVLWPWPALLCLISVYLVSSFSRSSYTSPFPSCKAVSCSCMPLLIPVVVLQFTALPLVPVWGHLYAGTALGNPQYRVALSSMVKWDKQSCKQSWQNTEKVHLSFLVIRTPFITNSVLPKVLLVCLQTSTDNAKVVLPSHLTHKHKHLGNLMVRILFL